MRARRPVRWRRSTDCISTRARPWRRSRARRQSARHGRHPAQPRSSRPRRPASRILPHSTMRLSAGVEAAAAWCAKNLASVVAPTVRGCRQVRSTRPPARRRRLRRAPGRCRRSRRSPRRGRTSSLLELPRIGSADRPGQVQGLAQREALALERAGGPGRAREHEAGQAASDRASGEASTASSRRRTTEGRSPTSPPI